MITIDYIILHICDSSICETENENNTATTRLFFLNKNDISILKTIQNKMKICC